MPVPLMIIHLASKGDGKAKQMIEESYGVGDGGKWANDYLSKGDSCGCEEEEPSQEEEYMDEEDMPMAESQQKVPQEISMLAQEIYKLFMDRIK